MNGFKQENKIKNGVLIAALVWVSVLLHLSSVLIGYTLVLIRFNEVYAIIIELLFTIVPNIIFGIYVTKAFKNRSSSAFIAIVLLCFIQNLSIKIVNYAYFSVPAYTMWRVVLCVAAIILAYFSVVFIVRRRKKASTMAMVSCVIAGIELAYIFIQNVTMRGDIYTVLTAGPLIFNIALIIFIASNGITFDKVNGGTNMYVGVGELPPDQALVVLKNKLDVGIITEEEYKAKRAEIISKL